MEIVLVGQRTTRTWLNDSIRECHGSSLICKAIEDDNSHAAVANNDFEESINLQFLELQEQRSLKRHKADGDTEIKEICSNMTDALAKIKDM